MRKRQILSLLIFSLAACAMDSGYRRYTLDPQQDLLLAHDPKDDLPLKATCQPDAQEKTKCIGMVRQDFYAMEKELLELRQALKDCQSGHNSQGK